MAASGLNLLNNFFFTYSYPNRGRSLFINYTNPIVSFEAQNQKIKSITSSLSIVVNY